jgi:hypothetical protein
MSTIYQFAKVELRPNHLQSADVIIPARTTGNYWLAIQVFSYGSRGWNQSAMRANASTQVPEVALAFDDRAPGIVWSGGGPSVELTIAYSKPSQSPSRLSASRVDRARVVLGCSKMGSGTSGE